MIVTSGSAIVPRCDSSSLPFDEHPRVLHVAVGTATDHVLDVGRSPPRARAGRPPARGSRRAIPARGTSRPRCTILTRALRSGARAPRPARPANRSSSVSPSATPLSTRDSARAGTPPTGRSRRSTESGSRIQCPSGSTWVRCASNAARRRVQPVPDVDERRVLARRSSGRLALEPPGVRALLAAPQELLVHRLDPPPREARVIELARRPRRPGIGELVGIARRVERGQRDLVHADVVGVRDTTCGLRRR